MDQRVIDRLKQYEFQRAFTYANFGGARTTPEELELIEALAETYGDPGWSMGGKQTTIIRYALLGLGVDVDDI